MFDTITRRAFGGVIATTVAAVARAADVASPPDGRPLLTVSGRIGAGGKGGPIAFDRAALEAFGMDAFETTTPWQHKPARFEGVPVVRVLRAVDARGEAATAVALDDYRIDIPISDFERFGVLLALKRDGAYMPVRDKGPLWIVYPYDGRPELKTQQFYNRAVWQLAKLIVK